MRSLEPQKYINHLKKAISEILGTKFQRNVKLKVNIFSNNTSKEFELNCIKTLVKWYILVSGNISILISIRTSV